MIFCSAAACAPVYQCCCRSNWAQLSAQRQHASPVQCNGAAGAMANASCARSSPRSGWNTRCQRSQTRRCGERAYGRERAHIYSYFWRSPVLLLPSRARSRGRFGDPRGVRAERGGRCDGVARPKDGLAQEDRAVAAREVRHRHHLLTHGGGRRVLGCVCRRWRLERRLRRGRPIACGIRVACLALAQPPCLLSLAQTMRPPLEQTTSTICPQITSIIRNTFIFSLYWCLWILAECS